MAYVTYDSEADAVLVRLRDYRAGNTAGRQIDELRIVHYDVTGEPVELEFLCVSKGIRLEGLPMADEAREALESFARLLSSATIAPE